MQLKWEKVDSVTVGGKKYFWFAKIGSKFNVKYRLWIVWDRFEKLWKLETEDVRTGSKLHSYFSTDKAAKKAAQTGDWIDYL